MRNRWFQLAAALVAMLMIANLQYAWTLFVAPMSSATGWDLSSIQWAFSIFVLFQTWVQPLDGWLLDRFGPRRFLVAAGLLCGAGWSMMGQADTLPQLYAWYALAGIGAAFVYSGSVGLALKWFPDRRGLATGVIAAGFGGGSALAIPAFTYLIRAHGYSTAFLVSGIVQGLVVMLASSTLSYPDSSLAAATPAPAQMSGPVRRNTAQFTTGEMLRSPQFLVLYLMFVAMATGGLMVTANAGPLQESYGLAPSALTAAVTLGPIANAASRILWGWYSDRAGRESTMVLAFTLQGLCLLGVATLGSTSAVWFVITLALTFFTWGQIFSLFPALLGDYFGARNGTSNYAFLYTAKGIAAVIGGGVAAMLFEVWGSWRGPLYGSAVLALASAALALYLKSSELPKPS